MFRKSFLQRIRIGLPVKLVADGEAAAGKRCAGQQGAARDLPKCGHRYAPAFMAAARLMAARIFG